MYTNKKKRDKFLDAAGKCIELELNQELAPEEYWLDVTKGGVKIQASSAAGFRYATQTIGQMLPAAFYGKGKASAKWVLPCASIKDKPKIAHTEECILTLPVISSCQ